MKISAVLAKISPNRPIVNLRRGFNGILKKSQGQDSFVLSKASELADRHKAIAKYIANEINVKKDSGVTPEYSYICSHNTGDVISECGNDVPKIDSLLGRYGLALYGNMPVELLVNNPKKLVEVPYKETEPAEASIYNFILSNDKGTVEDVCTRFGQFGKVVLDHCVEKGYVISNGNLYTVPYEKKDEMAVLVTVRHSNDAIRHLINDV